jgi:hypothetical protein
MHKTHGHSEFSPGAPGVVKRAEEKSISKNGLKV